MTAARLLDAAAAALGLATLAVLVTGGTTIAGLALTRAELPVVALALVVGLRALVAPVALPAVRPAPALAVGIAAYLGLMGVVVVTRHVALRTHALDLGYYVQLVWSLAHGHGARVSLPPMHAWGDHLSPVLYLLVPLGWLAPGAVSLLLAQTAILAAGAWAVQAFAQRRLGVPGLAAALALLYLANPTLHGINVRDIHPAAFAIPLVVAAAAAADAGRWGWCATALVLILGCREDAAVAVVGFGVWLALTRGRWRLGAGLALAALAILALEVRVVIPAFREEPYPHLGRYAHLGSGLPGIVGSLLVRPWSWLPVVLTWAKVTYLVALLAPLAFLPALAPRALAAVVPGLAMNLLSVDPILVHYRTQYQAFVLPFLVLAAVEGARCLREAPPGWARRVTPVAALTAGFVLSAVLGARTVNDLAVTRWILDPEQRAGHALLSRVPDGIAVSANERFVPHLATRRDVFVYPTGLGVSAYLLVHETELAREPAEGYAVIGQGGGWVLLRRR